MNTDKIVNLEEKDVILLGTILTGFAKMVCNIVNKQDPIMRASSHSHKELKHLVYSYILWNIPSIFREKRYISPSDIRDNLPEEWRGIQSSDLTDILNSFVRVEILKKGHNVDVIKRKWGRPNVQSDIVKRSGPKSFYEISEYYSNLSEFVMKDELVDIIFTILNSSGLIYKLTKFNIMMAFEIIRKNNRNTAWKILRTRNISLLKTELDFEREYQLIRDCNDNNLEELAERRTKSVIEKTSYWDYRDLYIVGGIFFKS